MKKIVLALLVLFVFVTNSYGQYLPGDGTPLLHPLHIWQRMKETGRPFTAFNEARMAGFMNRSGYNYPGYEFSWQRYAPYGRYGYGNSPRGFYGYYGHDTFGRVLSGIQTGLMIYESIDAGRTQRQAMRMEYGLAQGQQEKEFYLQNRELDVEENLHATQSFQAERKTSEHLCFTNETEHDAELAYMTDYGQLTFKFRPGETKAISLLPGDYPFYAYAIFGDRSVNCELVKTGDGISIRLGGRRK